MIHLVHRIEDLEKIKVLRRKLQLSEKAELSKGRHIGEEEKVGRECERECDGGGGGDFGGGEEEKLSSRVRRLANRGVICGGEGFNHQKPHLKTKRATGRHFH